MSENVVPDELTPKQEAVALAIATGQTIRDAAASIDIHERTVYRWIAASPAFRERVRELRKALFDEAVGRLAKLAGKAIDTIGGLLDSDSEPIKLSAGKTISDLWPKLREQTDLAEQLAELQRKIEEVQRGNNKHGQAGAATSGRHPPAGADGASRAGGTASGPEPHLDGGGHGAGPVASDSVTVAISPHVAPLFPPGG